ncbi:DNA (cytosine-5)-methyltransferase 1 [Paenibacillus taihuensis]|uniref:Cytosine-specific methyltransferase n=1 Tax=Paenibacillus taihuensis TaxID=1156355 RepID=A0A3D9SBG7_9BACL|nr:DNA cytosine methyltransferase [Paenibacillus taihuensis]REE90626.1 DNA (cytosine-5)-methyltransferase 1 [Paenibacillus taihuensis]
MNFIDLFAGAGGLSEGFIRQGFEPVAHIEMDAYAAQTLKTRAAYHYLKKNGRLDVYHRYLENLISRDELYQEVDSKVLKTVLNREISNQSIDELFQTIDESLENKENSAVDVLIGGPPCQAYSLVGRARDPYNKEHDPRNYLYQQYVKFLEKYKPKLFVFENVPGILTAGKGMLFEDVKRIMDEAGYNIEARILDASMFGVLQKRRRVILIGWVKGTDFFYPEFGESNHKYLVSDILNDVPALQPGETKDYLYATPPSEYLTKYGIRSDDDILVQHISRVHNEHDRGIYRLAIDKWDIEKKRLKYTDIPEENRTHKNITAFLDRFKVVAMDLNYSHTMVAHIAKDGHYYIHPDIKQLRSLSVREAARIQSFPDNFFFEGPRTATFTQIGNAVPPLMAEKIAEKIKQMLENKLDRQIELSF